MNSDHSEESVAPQHTPVASNHPDPITGEPDAHPIGVGVGAIGAGLAGAAIGAIGGPIGVVIGAAIGAVAGGLAGKEVASAEEDPIPLGEPVLPETSAEAVLPAAGLAGLQTGGMPGALLSAEPMLAHPYREGMESAESFHESFTSTTFQEGVDEEQSENQPSYQPDHQPMVESLTPLTADAGENVDDGADAGLHGQVRTAAYYRFLERNASHMPGDALGDWLGAEQEILH